MERTVSVEDRIRRAEEIYARRRNDSTSTSIPYARVPIGEKKKSSPIKRMLIQICVCAMIYVSLVVIKNGDYIFTPQLTEKIKHILEYDMNIQNMGEDILKYINEIRNKNVVIPEENQAEAENTENNTDDNVNNEQQIQNNTEILTENEQQTNQAVEQQPAETLGITDEPLYTEEASSISQTQIEADYIKQNFSIIKPLEGTITSRFGNRNPTTETVPKYHTGIDIARETGAKIIAAMEGEVTLVSSSGDYGNHLKIVNGEVTTLYAHCNKIYVNKGDHIVQGQEIAEVGATGNVTGPHLHFEIRRNNNLVDPDAILDF